MLSLATVLTVIELDHVRSKALSSVNPTGASRYALHTAAGYGAGEHREHMRKDKEEIRHMSHSYGVLMRSHPTAGTA